MSVIGRIRLAANVLAVVALVGGLASAADDAAKLRPTPSAGASGGMPPANNSLGLLSAPLPAPEKKDEACEFAGASFCGPPGRFWIRADYGQYWTSGMRVPALVTTGPQNTGLTATTDPAGSLDQPGTQVLYGDSTLLFEGRSAFHINMGFWLDACQNWGIEADWLDLGPQNASYSIASNSAGDPILARPYYDVQAAREWRQLVSYPNTLSGTVSVDSGDYFNTAGVALRKQCFCCQECGCEDTCTSRNSCGAECFSLGNGSRLDMLFGYRYYGMNDHVTIHENLLALGAPITGTRIQVTDAFRAANQFHGAEIGMAAQVFRGRWTLDMSLRTALGNNRQTVNIAGQTITTNSVGQSITSDAGVYAVRSNIGTYTHNEFTVIPQINLEVGYMLTCHWRTFIGYNLIYWSNVQRSGNAIDLNVDPRNIPNGLQDPATHFPQFKFCGSSYWAQGIQGGLEYRY